MSECIHGMGDPSWCSFCRYTDEGSVWISDGGAAFHRNRDCEALAEGQRRVERWGGETHEVRQVARPTAERLGRQPCLVCIGGMQMATARRGRR